ncbi:PFL family protein [Desulfohalobiaceae bacterium Ax17]|uniref:PFL family protein n=1 Tax=Desulfovulcanus ferrireducens TaxID=2831190 RepID=UPI00207BB055|nr:PFL family protein [Desulfovulcanus ferrireducens]MBT8764064.1 PFL family protein [Desulfovulcanus ferrireducens]
MLSEREVLSTFEMIKNEHLDVRTVTLGISLFDCASDDLSKFFDKIYTRIVSTAKDLVRVCDEVGDKYGIPVVNKRIAISPMAIVAAPFDSEQMVEIARTLDKAAREVQIDFIGGFSALVEKGMATGDLSLIEAIPEALTQTERVCASVNVASTKAGINMDGVYLMGKTIKEAAHLTRDRDGLACAKLCVFANIPQDIPFMAGAYLGVGEPGAVINVGVSGPGVVKKAIDRTLEANPEADLGMLSETIKKTAFKVTKIGELIGREVAKKVGVQFGIVDLSLAPTPNVGDSVGEIFQSLGLDSIGVPGSTAILAMLNDAVKKGGSFASSYVGGLSGAFIPVSEDLNIANAARDGFLNLEKLEAMTSVCSVGLDMVAVPGDTSAETLAAIIADEMAIGVINRKTTATRIIPVPGKKAGDKAYFGGLLGEATIMPVREGFSEKFIRLGGLIPAPLQSLNN